MSTLSDFRDAYYTFTGKVSDNVRSLSIAAVAIVWVFKKDITGGLVELPHELYYSLLFVFCALALDFCQYVYGSIAWGSFCRSQEKKGIADDKEIEANPYMNWPTNILFYLKIASVIFAYVSILNFLVCKIVIR